MSAESRIVHWRSEGPYELVEHRAHELSLPIHIVRQLLAIDRLGLQASPGPSGDQWVLTPSSVVGVATVDDVQFLIRPKIGIRNLLALMDVTATSERWASDLFEYQQEPDLLTAMVRIYLRAVDRALAQGLRRDYQGQEDRLLAIRGRIDSGAIIRRPGPIMPVPCVFDDHTPDIGPNRLLLAATRRLLRVPHVHPADRRRLHRLEQTFEGVTDDPDPVAWAHTWVPNRLDQHYLPAVRVAALLLQNLSLKDAIGGTTATTFLIDMNQLVETFITEHLRRLCLGSLEVRGQFRMFLDNQDRVASRPDLVFLARHAPVFVADIKYKAVQTVEDVSTEDLYQLLAYATALGLPSGALITCLTDRAMAGSQDRITVRGSGVRLELWPLDLTGSPADIRHELAEIVDRIGRNSVRYEMRT